MFRIRSAILVTLIALLTPAVLQAYEPVRWSPLDAYLGRIVASSAHAPKGVKAVDPQGGLLSQAEYEYKQGRLVREVFRNGDGEHEGETRYLYDAGRIQEERTLDEHGQLVSRMQVQYDGGKIIGVEVYDAEGELQMSQSYVYKDDRIVGGVERSGGEEDEFQIRYENNRPAAFVLRNAENGVVQSIRYRYNDQGRLEARIREAFGQVSRCVYSYDPQGRLLSYTYADRLADGSWSASKKLEFRYPEN